MFERWDLKCVGVPSPSLPVRGDPPEEPSTGSYSRRTFGPKHVLSNVLRLPCNLSLVPDSGSKGKKNGQKNGSAEESNILRYSDKFVSILMATRSESVEMLLFTGVRGAANSILIPLHEKITKADKILKFT